MSVNKNRAYLRAVELYENRTGRDVQISDYNIIQDIVQALLEEIYLHSKIPVGIAVQVTNASQIYSGTTVSEGTIIQLPEVP